MKYLYSVIAFVMLSISCTKTSDFETHLFASDIETHLFILSGQSNMAYLNPNVSFIPAVESVFGKDNVIIVKDAHSGQPIRRWYKNWKPAQGDKPMANGDLYDILMEKVKMVIEGNKVTTITFIWMQGEADAREKNGGV